MVAVLCEYPNIYCIYTLNKQIVFYVNYISVKYFKK